MGRHFLLHKNDIKILKNYLEAITYIFFLMDTVVVVMMC